MTTFITDTNSGPRPRWHQGIAAMVLCSLSALRYGLAADHLAELESRIPKDVEFTVIMNDAAKVGMQFRATSIGKMLKSSDWQPYYSVLHETSVPCLLHLRPWFGVDWADVSEFSVPMAFLIFRDAKSEIAAALLVDSRSDTVAAETLLERSTRYFKERGARLVTTSLPNGSRIVYQLPAEFLGNSRPVSLWQQGYLALVSSQSGAEALEQSWNQTSAASLSQLEAYQGSIRAASESIAREPTMRFWIRPLALAHSIAKKPADGSRRRRRDWLASAERQGLDALQGIGGVLALSGAESPSLEVQFVIHARRAYAKGMQMASLVPGAWRDPPPFVSDTAASWFLMYEDVNLWFDGYGYLFDEINDPESPGAFRDVLEAIRRDPEGPRIDIEREIVARLAPGFVEVHDYEGARSAQNPQGFRALYQLAAVESDQLRAVFERCFEGDDEVHVSAVGGQTMWSTTTGRDLLFDTGEEKDVAITSMAVIDRAVLLCTDADWLRSALLNAKSDNPLFKSPAFVSAKNFLASRQSSADSLWSFKRVAEDWKSPYQHLREAKSDADANLRIQLLEWLLCPSSSNRRRELLARLPPWTVVGPSLGTVAISLRVTPAGYEGCLGVLPATAPIQSRSLDGQKDLEVLPR